MSSSNTVYYVACNLLASQFSATSGFQLLGIRMYHGTAACLPLQGQTERTSGAAECNLDGGCQGKHFSQKLLSSGRSAEGRAREAKAGTLCRIGMLEQTDSFGIVPSSLLLTAEYSCSYGLVT